MYLCRHRKSPILIVAAALLLTASERQFAAEPLDASMSFHRVYAPADRIDEWPRGSVRYVPMDREAFEKTVAEIAAEATSPANHDTRVEQAVYTARLDDNGFLQGRAELTVSHKAGRGVLLPLGDCDLAITAAAWADEPTQAILAVDGERQLTLLVERPGTLRVDFVLRGQTSPGSHEFKARFPSGVVARWLLDAPSAAMVVAEGSIVEAAAEASDAASNATEATTDAPRRRWRIEFGGRNQLALSLRSPQVPGEHVVASTQSTEYSITESGLSFTTKFVLNYHRDAGSRITVRIDPEATLVGSQVAGVAAKVVGFRRATDGGQWITLELSAAALGDERVLTLEAIAPANLARRWRLPRIVAQDLPWKTAEARISVQAPLRIAQLWPTNAQLASAATPRAANLTYFAADAHVDVVVDWEPREIRAATARLLEIGSEARGQAVLDAVFPDGTPATIVGRIHEDWIVEGVAATPAESVIDWRIAADAQGRESVVVECRPDATGRARISATVRRRDSPEQRPISAAELHVVDWRESCHVTRSLASIAPAQTYQLSTIGGHRLTSIDATDEAARQLLAGHSGALQFDLEGMGTRFALQARRAATPYRGEIDVESHYSAESVRDTFRLRCAPEGDGLTQVVVRIVPPSDEKIVWTDAANPGEELAARRLSDSELRAFLIEPGSEAWLFSFAQPRSAAFELIGHRLRKFDAAAAFALAAFQNSAAQTGSVTVRAAHGLRISIDNRRLVAAPQRDQSLTELSDARGTYRFSPARDLLATDPAAIVARVSTPPDAAAVAYASQVTGRIHPDGKTAWRVSYALENFGRADVAIALPKGATRYEVLVDGQLASKGESPGDAIRALLPKGRRFANVVVNFECTEAGLEWFARRTLQAPEIDVPVLQRQWTLWMRDDFDVVGPARGAGVASSWSARWFGLLARPADERPFDPTSWASWMGQSPRRIDAEAARATVEAFLDRVGTARSKLGGETGATWGALLGAAADDRTIVDVAALDRAAIAPWTRLPAAARESERTAAIRLLYDADLAVATDGSRCVLTAASRAASFHEAMRLDIEPQGGVRLDVLWVAARELENVADRDLATATDWSQGAITASLPWTFRDPQEHMRGWRKVDLAEDAAVVSVRFVDLTAIRVAAWIGLIAAAALAWLLARRVRVVWGAMAATAVVALLLDDRLLHFAPVLWGIWWGLCLGLLVAAVPWRTRGGRKRAEAPSAESWRWKRTAAATGLFLAATFWVVQSWANEGAVDGSPRAAAPAAATVHQVFFPIDDNQKPVGTRVYVPEPLFARLERWSLDRQRGPQGTLFTSATHQIQLDWNADGTMLEPRQATALVDVVTFDDEATVRIPIPISFDPAGTGEASANPPPPAIRLDGGLLEPEGISLDGGIATFVIAKAGSHRIELPMPLEMVDRGGRKGFVAKPIAAGSTRIEVRTPENGPEVEIAAAEDEQVLQRGRGMIATSLATGRSFAVRWVRARPRAAEGQIESAERLWLDVQPGAVGFAAEVIVSSAAGLPDELRIAADTRLVPISATVDGAATTWRRSATTEEQLTLRLGTASGAREARLEVKFLLRATSGIGNLRLPRWEPVVKNVRRRWLAVNIDESLDRELAAPGETPPMTPADFVQDESEDLLPHYAFRLPVGPSTWSLTTRRKTSRVRFDPTLVVIAEPQRTKVVVDAEISIASGDVYAHVLRVNEPLRVERLSISEDGVDRVAFWTQSAEGVVSVFLRDRAGARQRLRLEGHVAANSSGEVIVGDIAIDGAQRAPSKLRLYRMPSVRLAIVDLTGFTESQNAAQSSRTTTSTAEQFALPANARLVRELAAAADTAPAATLRLQPNSPKIDATSVLAVDTIDAETWSARAEFRGNVSEGIVDDLVVDLPGDWLGEPVVEPPMPTTVLDGANGGRRLLVRPVLPLRGEFAFSVAGRIRAPTSRTVPRWKLLDADVLREFFVLPTLWQGRSMGWDLAEVRRGSPGAGFAMPRRDGARYEGYQLVGDRASATLQAEVPGVRTLEAYVDVVATETEMNDGSQSLIATYDLLPKGVASCEIVMPPAARLVSIVLEDRPVTPREAGENAWRVDLESDSLPQRLQVVAIADAGKTVGGVRVWTAPRISNATIRQTTWRVATAAGAQRIVATEASGASAVAADEDTLAATRAKAIAELWSSAAASSSEFKSLVARRWERRLEAATRLRNRSAQSGAWSYVVAGDVGAAMNAATATLAQQFGAARLGQFGDDVVFELPTTQARRFADQLVRDGGGGARAMEMAAPPKIIERSALLGRAGGNPRVTGFAADGEAWTLQTRTESVARWPWLRWILALGIAVFAADLIRNGSRRRFAESLVRRPYLVLVGVGVMWWLWLWPGWVGWLLMATGVLLAWGLAWPLPRVDARMRPSSNS